MGMMPDCRIAADLEGAFIIVNCSFIVCYVAGVSELHILIYYSYSQSESFVRVQVGF
jgi:uncharacterized MAPEG superfamily protein